MAFNHLTWFQKVLLFIFLVHVSAFLVFVYRKVTEAEFEFTRPEMNFTLILVILAILIPVYFKWLRKIRLMRLLGNFIKKTFFVLYTAVLIYLLLGFIFNPPITITQAVNFFKGFGLKRNYVAGHNLGPNIRLAVIASEDQLYPDHDGFDVKAIKKAIKYNKRNPGRIRGASTISQQTAKNIFLWQGGGFFRKGLEVFFTFTIESVWTKDLILTRYLNIAEMGPGIFGAQAAAKAYYQKDAKALTEMEAASIAAILPNPRNYKIKGSYVTRRANAIRRQMRLLKADKDVMKIVGN